MSEPTNRNPWAPFRSYADFTFAEQAVGGHWSQAEIDRVLNSLHGEWTQPNKSNVSFTTSRDLDSSLTAARQYIVQVRDDSTLRAHFDTVQFQTGTVSVPYKGQMRHFSFQYRDPWEWMSALLQDPTLAEETHLFSVKKFYCDRSRNVRERLIDEPWTADTWNEVDVSCYTSVCFECSERAIM